MVNSLSSIVANLYNKVYFKDETMTNRASLWLCYVENTHLHLIYREVVDSKCTTGSCKMMFHVNNFVYSVNIAHYIYT